MLLPEAEAFRLAARLRMIPPKEKKQKEVP